jgi:hypothetical protein
MVSTHLRKEVKMAIPSIIIHTAKRFGYLTIWAAAGIAIANFLPRWFQFSADHLGSPWYGVATVSVMFILFISYRIAQMDVEQEERRRARVLASLKGE